jgi:peptide deformylase
MLYNLFDMPSNTRLCPVLKAERISRKCGVVETPEGIQELIWKMIRACVADGGIGLAAPQIGVFKRVFVAEETPGVFRAYINPSFTVIPGSTKDVQPEGCLSVPGKTIPVSRFVDIVASWTEITHEGAFENHKEVFIGFPGRVFQHELDHLNSISILDRYNYQHGKKR